jgi:hypothetical protein
MINNMEELHNWLFHYNPYRKLWTAFRREHTTPYFNGELKNTLSSKDFKTLVEILAKTNGDEKKIKKLLKDG